MKILDALLGIIFRNKSKYDKLKEDDEKRETSQYLGVGSILSTIFGVIFAVASVWVAAAMFSGSADSLDSLVGIIGLFLLAVLFVGLFLQLIANGLVCAILQMKLNRKPIGLISLILWLIFIVAAVVILAVVIFS